MRLIDADTLADALFDKRKNYPQWVADTIGNMPDAVVRCKDCKHSEPWYGDKSRCFLWHETGIDVFNDGFCNYGERKEGR